MNSPGNSEGWYPDPNVPGQLRWWNALEWTDHTQPAPGAPIRRVAHPAPPRNPPPSRRRLPPPPKAEYGDSDGRDTGGRLTKIGLIAVIVLGLGLALSTVGSGGGGGPGSRAPTSAADATPSTIPFAPAADIETAAIRLAELAVAEPDSQTSPYIRDDYHPDGWSDLDDDCQTTRHEVLLATSNEPATMDETGCQVVAGLWLDPYTGETLTTADAATIDHVVPLAEAHRSGAWRWDQATKERFANDNTPSNFRVVGAVVNQSKSDKRPDQWLPPNQASHCAYTADWIAVKYRWQLTVTDAEAKALAEIIAGCPSGTPIQGSTEAPPLIVTTTTPPPTTTTIPVSAGPGLVQIMTCDRYSERVVIANTGGESISLSSYRLHDDGNKHTVELGQYGSLTAGQSLTLLTGSDAKADSETNTVVWKRQDVWNNDGDTANLLNPDGTTTSLSCS